MAAASLISPSLCCNCSSIRDVRVYAPSKPARKLGNVFAAGSPLLMKESFYRRSRFCKGNAVSIRCEQSSNGLDIWVGRLAMATFAAAITVEIATGKGLLENLGLTTPLPSVALAAAAVGGVAAAFFIFQSTSKT